MVTARRRWVETLARVGFAVKGVLYLLLGGLTLQFALGTGGQLTDARGAILSILNTPHGPPLVAGVAAGLALYAAWRFLEAFADANNLGTDAKGLAARAVYALSGTVYGLLAFDAAILVVARPGAGGTMEWPPTVIGSALAEWAALLVAVALIVYGGSQFRRAFLARLSDQLSQRRVERRIGPWPARVSRIGIAGRGVVLMVMGLVLARRAAASVDAATRTDTGDSLRLIAALPSGGWLLAAIAAGLMAYGVFQLVQARYRTITAP